MIVSIEQWVLIDACGCRFLLHWLGRRIDCDENSDFRLSALPVAVKRSDRRAVCATRFNLKDSLAIRVVINNEKGDSIDAGIGALLVVDSSLIL